MRNPQMAKKEEEGRERPLAFPGIRLASQQEWNAHRSVCTRVECNGLSSASHRHKLGLEEGQMSIVNMVLVVVVVHGKMRHWVGV